MNTYTAIAAIVPNAQFKPRIKILVLEDNIKIEFNNLWGCGLDSVGSEMAPDESSNDHSDEF